MTVNEVKCEGPGCWSSLSCWSLLGWFCRTSVTNQSHNVRLKMATKLKRFKRDNMTQFLRSQLWSWKISVEQPKAAGGPKDGRMAGFLSGKRNEHKQDFRGGCLLENSHINTRLWEKSGGWQCVCHWTKNALWVKALCHPAAIEDSKVHV
jgi:hypothetical protein